MKYLLCRCCKYKRGWSSLVNGLVPCEWQPPSSAVFIIVHSSSCGGQPCVPAAVTWHCCHSDVWLWSPRLQVWILCITSMDSNGRISGEP